MTAREHHALKDGAAKAEPIEPDVIAALGRDLVRVVRAHMANDEEATALHGRSGRDAEQRRSVLERERQELYQQKKAIEETKPLRLEDDRVKVPKKYNGRRI